MTDANSLVRSTTIRIKNIPNEVSPDYIQSKAFSILGCNYRTVTYDTKYFDGIDYVREWELPILIRHNIPFQKTYFWYTTGSNYECGKKVTEFFKIKGYVDMHSWSFTVTTEGLTKIEHRKEIQKIYKPLKKVVMEMGYQLEHGCETERTSNSKC